MDRGDPISYRVLAKGTPVETSDGERIGTVKRVLEVREKDVFDGVVVTTEAGDRFVDGPDVAELYEGLMILKLSSAEAAKLPKPGENPAAMSVDPDDAARSNLRQGARKLWDRVSGRY